MSRFAILFYILQKEPNKSCIFFEDLLPYIISGTYLLVVLLLVPFTTSHIPPKKWGALQRHNVHNKFCET